MRESSRYLAIAALTTVLLVGAVAAVNAAVDPFGMTRAPARVGFNANKPGIYHRVRLAKAYDVRHIAPRAIVLGTSRSHLGLRMTHSGWQAAPRYNLAFDGAEAREMYAYLVHAHAVRPVQQVVLGLDTWQLSDRPSDVRPGFDGSVLLHDASLLSWVGIRAADLRLLAGVDTLWASYLTIQEQGPDEPNWLAADGQRVGERFFRRPGSQLHDENPRAYFDAYTRMELGWQRPPPPAPHSAAPPAPAEPAAGSRAWIVRIIEFCREQRIDLRIFITPMHAHQAEILAATGEAEQVENQKRALVTYLAEDARRHPDRAPIPFWDFSGHSSVTTERLPAPESKDEMRYYWDSSHFKELVGDWVLDRLFGVVTAAEPVPDDFGVLLTPENVERALQAMRVAGEAYRLERADEVNALRGLVAEILGIPVKPVVALGN
jgi:hypothetical protein